MYILHHVPPATAAVHAAGSRRSPGSLHHPGHGRWLPRLETPLPRPWRTLHTRATTGNPTMGSSAEDLAPPRALQHRRPLYCSCSSTATAAMAMLIHAPTPAVLAQVPFPLYLQ